MKIEWALYETESACEKIHFTELDKDIYNKTYRDNLFCITEMCNAKIKFTEKTNGTKYYSTWNNQGNKHSENCPYYLMHKDQVERNKVKENLIRTSLSDDHIENTILNKSRNLKKSKEVVKPKEQLTTRRVIDGEEQEMPKAVDDGTIGEETVSGIRIGSIEGKFLTPDYVGFRKCVYGRIKSAYMNEESGYVYLNLENEFYNFSVYLPQAFYADPKLTTIESLKIFVDIMRYELLNQENVKDLVIVCVGHITEKQSSGYNVRVLNPRHLLINDMKYYEVIRKGFIKECDYIL